ncbi:MAG: hypothetical protein UHG91_05635 [Succinivibrionaceae bacterium]|nr:hypothetical protein [Succinivibrionaceae bacterium]
MITKECYLRKLEITRGFNAPCIVLIIGKVLINKDNNEEMKNEALKCLNSLLFATIISILFCWLLIPIFYVYFIMIRGIIYGVKGQKFEEKYVVKMFTKDIQ